MSQAPTFPAIKSLCAAFVERADALNYPQKGKKLDSAALDYIIGAAKIAEIIGNTPIAAHLAGVAYIVSIRGMFEVRHIAETPLE